MKRYYFGTDGVRGPYGGPVVNEGFMARLGFAAAHWARTRGAVAGDWVLIGRDTRASGQSLAEALAVGLRLGGLHPVSLGVLPTPAVARALVAGGQRLAAVVTASHNPAADNGVKFFTLGGYKLSDTDEAELEAALPAELDLASGKGDWSTNEPNGAADYTSAMAARLPPDSLRGWRMVVDTANGATCGTTPAVLRKLGAEISPLGAEPDGHNINLGVGSEYPEMLARTVLAQNAKLGIAHDGDGDRCVLCDELGSVLDGDEILTILALDALRRGNLAVNTLVVTTQSNLGVDAAITQAGGRVERTEVGDRYVLARLRATGARLGGESSGHIINLDASPTGDGLAATLGVLAIMRATGQPLSVLRTALKKFPQGTRNLRVAEKRSLSDCPALCAELDLLERTFAGRGRAMARFSGTEPKLRLLAEAHEPSAVLNALARLETAARRDLEIG
jgi:phosphoglucosamine mutase